MSQQFRFRKKNIIADTKSGMSLPHLKLKSINFRIIKDTCIEFVSFTMLLFVYLTGKFLTFVTSRKYFPKVITEKTGPPLFALYKKIMPILEMRREGTISRVELIELSIRNMRAKRTRTIITIGGMALGIGVIVFLVSIGYGLQELVVSRVARLDEMKQTDVSVQPGAQILINDKTLADIKQINNVDMVLPLISVVGRVNFQNSVSDMAVYGVTSDYLKQSAIQPIQGKIFDSNNLTVSVRNDSTTGQVAGVSTSADEEADVGEKIQDVEFTIHPEEWIRVRKGPSRKSAILGYTKRTGATEQGEEMWGEEYLSDDGVGEAGENIEGKTLGKWIKAPVRLWKEGQCDTSIEGDCEGGTHTVLRNDDNTQLQKTGYFAEINVTIKGATIIKPSVLGITTEDLDAEIASDVSSLDFVEIASEAGTLKQPETKQVNLGTEAKKQAVVNRAALKILGIKETNAVGKKFNVSFVATGDLLTNASERIESVSSEYEIIGVTPDDRTPVFYVPFIDLRSIGITNYSQMKVVVQQQAELATARKQIEALGYSTRSVADTVNQINSLFSTARTILALLGMVALGVAALGMFNTLTVSLLERTREVGLMKAMGMKSSEVRELFLTESMIMGLFGGLLGLLLGFLGGEMVGLLLSLFAIAKGVGYIDISYIPLSFVLVIVVISLFVGLATGIYPAKRATKISALDALRYE